MKFVADESMERGIVQRLRQDSHLVVFIAEIAAGSPDEHVLELANQESGILLTADKDFGELVFLQKRVALDVVLTRLGGLPLTRKVEITATAIKDHLAELAGAFTVIAPGIVRIRR